MVGFGLHFRSMLRTYNVPWVGITVSEYVGVFVSISMYYLNITSA